MLQQFAIELYLPRVRQSERATQLVAYRCTAIGSSGRVYNKAEISAPLRAEAPSDIVASNISVQLVAPGKALLRHLAYRPSANSTDSYRSSIRQRQNGQWRMLSQRSTPCSPPT